MQTYPVVWRDEDELVPAVGKLTLSDDRAVLEGMRGGLPESREFAAADVRSVDVLRNPHDHHDHQPMLRVALTGHSRIVVSAIGLGLIYEIADVVAQWPAF